VQTSIKNRIDSKIRGLVSRPNTGGLTILMSILSLASILSIVGCCEERVIKTEESPDHKYQARLKQVNCGATTPFGTMLELAPTAPRFGISWLGHQKGENVYFVNRDASHITFQWIDNDRIDLTCSGCKQEEVEKRLLLYQTISIRSIEVPQDQKTH